jgi:hypothetical protein
MMCNDEIYENTVLTVLRLGRDLIEDDQIILPTGIFTVLSRENSTTTTVAKGCVKQHIADNWWYHKIISGDDK